VKGVDDFMEVGKDDRFIGGVFQELDKI